MVFHDDGQTEDKGSGNERCRNIISLDLFPFIYMCELEEGEYTAADNKQGEQYADEDEQRNIAQAVEYVHVAEVALIYEANGVEPRAYNRRYHDGGRK